MKTIKFLIMALLLCSNCTNSPDLETTEAKTFQLLKKSLDSVRNPGAYIDAKEIVTRAKIDSAKVPLLYVELQSGQNGTLTLYPGKGKGNTWLGVDGATITFDKGVLIASRGMGSDVMGGSTSISDWKKIKIGNTYNRKLSYIRGDNDIYIKEFLCTVKKSDTEKIITVFQVQFDTTLFVENCRSATNEIENHYFVDELGVVRRSRQYHGDKTGYIITERLDR